MGLQHTPTGTRGCATQPAPIEQRRFRDVPAVVLAAFALPLVAAGLTLILGAGGGLYWLVPAIVMSQDIPDTSNPQLGFGRGLGWLLRW